MLALLEQELSRIRDEEVKAFVTIRVVAPRCEARGWDYGEAGTNYPCWIVLEDRTTNTGIAYCEHGFGPKCPWGLLFLDGPNMSMGPDYCWYPSLEEAVKDGFMA